MKKLILASTSPYRAELLERFGIPFEQVDSKVDEDFYKQKISNPFELATTLAFEKAKSVFLDNPDAVVIGGDQVSLFGPNDRTGEHALVLGKPGNYENAVSQLSLLEGNKHQLITCVCVFTKNSEESFQDITTLKMRKLNIEEIKRYVTREEPYYCAGSYKIETVGISLFDEVQTNDFTAIVGLPLIQLSKALRKMGYQLP
jgi:septum formation protein